MLNKEYTYAIVGATNDEDKYGYKALKDLKDSGYKVVPVNLKEKEILGLKAYKNIRDIGTKVDVVVFVVPPAVTEKILPDVKKIGIGKVWMQPGSESDDAIRYCEDNGIECTHNACVIMENNK